MPLRGGLTLLSLAEVREHRVDELKGLVDFLAYLGTSEDDLARDEDEQHNLRFHHTVDQTREEFGLVGAEHVVATCQTLKTNRELDVARADDVLDLEVRELGIEAELLDDTRILAASKLAVIFGFRTSNNHLAGSEDQRGRLGLTDTHDDGSETLRVVLSVTCMQGDRLEVEPAVEIHCSDDVPIGTLAYCQPAAESSDTYCRVGTMPETPP